MEIDLTQARKFLPWLALALGLLFLILLGRAFTPAGNLPLTWREWQIRKAQQAYRQERAQLLQDAQRLSDLLAQSPDPARAQVEIAAIRRRLTDGQDALAAQRAALEAACEATLAWASGTGEYNVAVDTLQTAIALLEK